MPMTELRSRICLMYLLLAAPAAASADCVILLHGLARTSASMNELADAFADAGFDVANIGYPSRKHPIEELAPMVFEKGLAECPEQGSIHVVTHSLGGILTRHYLADHELPRLGRVVMLAPPNQGSEVVDRLRRMPGFAAYNGPAGLQLGTDADSIPRRLPPVDFPLGVIAGTRSINLLLSRYLPNPDDGKVSVASAKVAGMSEFVEVPYSHPFIMTRAEVVELALRFIQTGTFRKN